MMRALAVLTLAAAALAGCNSPTDPAVGDGVIGTYTLTSVNGDPVPSLLIGPGEIEGIDTFYLTRASIVLRADQSYYASTCYALVVGKCDGERREYGTYTVDEQNVVALVAGDGYFRDLVVTRPGILTQTGSGDFQCFPLDNGVERCFVLVYTRTGR